MEKICILLADDHTLVRSGIRALLEAEPDFSVVGEAEDGRAAVTLACQLKPDVVLMDIAMPLLNGLEATRQLKQQCPETRVLALLCTTTRNISARRWRPGRWATS